MELIQFFYSQHLHLLFFHFRHVFEYLNNLLRTISNDRKTNIHHLTKDLHVWPDFHGNRSPLADPNLKGMICGLSMDSSEENLALIYLAFVQAIAVIIKKKLTFIPCTCMN